MNELSFAFHNEMEDPIITMATPAVDWSNAWDYESLAEIVGNCTSKSTSKVPHLIGI